MHANLVHQAPKAIIIMESGPLLADNELGPTLPPLPGGCSQVPFSASASVTPVCSSFCPSLDQNKRQQAFP